MQRVPLLSAGVVLRECEEPIGGSRHHCADGKFHCIFLDARNNTCAQYKCSRTRSLAGAYAVGRRETLPMIPRFASRADPRARY